MRQVTDWTSWFLDVCRVSATRSKDDSTQVGSCIVKDKRILAVGYNGFPSGINESPERWERPAKYTYVVHAEMNAILQSARFGVSLDGSTLYSSLHPCANCAKHIAQAGIVEVVYDGTQPIRDEHEHWIAAEILKEAGVSIVSVGSIAKSASSSSCTSTQEFPSNGYS